MRYDVNELRDWIERGVSDDEPALTGGEWLVESWREPSRFWQALLRHHAGLPGAAPRSRCGERYDLFHDFVGRHAPERIALRTHAPGVGWRVLRYGQLAELASRRAGDWAARGISGGAHVALLLPMGEELVVSLLAALRLGLVVTLLPPLGPSWVGLRLQAAQPDYVVTMRRWLPLRGDAGGVLLVDEPAPARAADERASDLAAAATAARLFSPLAPAGHTPVDVSAETLYLGALRDGLLLHALRPGEQLAAPGSSLLQHQPALLLSALACGATYVHVELEALAAEPTLLDDVPLRSVGVDGELRDLMLRWPRRRARPWSHWFRNPEDVAGWPAWERFIAQQGLADVPTSNLLVDACSGGATLWSRRRRGRVHRQLWPAAGRPWSLAACGGGVSAPAREALGDTGLFCADGAPAPPYVILTRAGQEDADAGTRTPRRAGAVYPRQEVARVAAAQPWVLDATVLVLPGDAGELHRVLLAFSGAYPQARERVAELSAAIAAALGAELVPDRIEIFPLYARRRDGTLDEAWCRAQYLSGELQRKAQWPTFQLITLLRHAVAVSAAQPAQVLRAASARRRT